MKKKFTKRVIFVNDIFNVVIQNKKKPLKCDQIIYYFLFYKHFLFQNINT